MIIIWNDIALAFWRVSTEQAEEKEEEQQQQQHQQLFNMTFY